MKALLIIGAGEHGAVVREVAEACGYDDIIFVDDRDLKAAGTTDDLEKLRTAYPCGIVAIGNNTVREKLQSRLLELGYEVPVLIHPTAYVSPSAQLAAGTVVEPKAVINTNAVIGEGAIISIGALVDHDTRIGKYAHVNTGAIVKSFGKVEDHVRIDAGNIVERSK